MPCSKRTGAPETRKARGGSVIIKPAHQEISRRTASFKPCGPVNTLWRADHVLVTCKMAPANGSRHKFGSGWRQQLVTIPSHSDSAGIRYFVLAPGSSWSKSHSRDEPSAFPEDRGIAALRPISHENCGKMPILQRIIDERCPSSNTSSYRVEPGFGKFSCKLWRWGYSGRFQALAW